MWRRVTFALMVALGSCDGEDEVCDGVEGWLTGGQTVPVGTTHVSNDGDTLTFTYETTGGWEIGLVHLHVGCSESDIPTNQDGSISPGQLDWSVAYDPAVTSATIEVPLSSLSCAPSCGDELVIVAHAEVSNPGTGAAETAWASSFDPNAPPEGSEDLAFGGAQWGWYFPYVLECCDDDGGQDSGRDETPIPGGSGTGGETPIPGGSGGSGGSGSADSGGSGGSGGLDSGGGEWSGETPIQGSGALTWTW